MNRFEPISSDDPIRDVIKQAFDMDMVVDGGWGYSADMPIILHANSMPPKQLQHTLASMRAHLEMGMTLPPDKRYGGSNLPDLCRPAVQQHIEAVTYRVTAMPESDYADFIKIYKEKYGTEGFDMEAHFNARKEATLEREITVLFERKETMRAQTKAYSETP
jgi:hypothetical protein